MLQVYTDFYKETLAIPAVTGARPKRKNSPARWSTYTIEAADAQRRGGFRAGARHYFGDGFAKAFDITYTARDNTVKYPHQTSWGCFHPDDRCGHYDPRGQ